MNVYDFDRTIYNGDCSIDFYFFILKRYPAILRSFPKLFICIIRHKIRRCSAEELKESFFSFLNDIPDAQEEAEIFWKTNIKKISPWYLEQKHKTDVIISASPYFLLILPCRILNIQKLIATDINITNGKIHGNNCKGKEKADRFRKMFPAEKIEKFYSDSYSDTPIAKLAEKAYIVKHGKVKDWRIL